MKAMLLAVACLFIVVRTQAQAIQPIYNEAFPKLPPGVPRTVDTNGNVLFIDTMFTTRAFQEEALRLVIEEANKVAKELQLPESLPITRTNLTHAFIGAFGFVYEDKSLGNVTTSNYWYGLVRDCKFSRVTVAKIDDRCHDYAEKYQRPIEQLDTNAAFQLATQWLAAVRMDVQGLNRDYDVHVDLDPYWNNVRMGELPRRSFSPIYYVSWLAKGRPPYSAGGGASVELFLPTKTLLSLSVDDPKYILRQRVVFTNLAALFPGKATITTNYPPKSPPTPIDARTLFGPN